MDVKVTYIRSDGQVRAVSVPVGSSVMHAAVSNGVPEILGDCGGELSCATCHVYVEDDVIGQLAPMCSEENDMLDAGLAPRESNSRLSCQIQLTPALDGLIVRTPVEQF